MSSDTPLQHTFAFKLGDLLSTRWGKRVDAINGGVDGYGTYQEMAYYRYLGRFLSPGVVVLCVFTGNDFRDNMVSTMNRSRISPLLLKDDTPGYRHRENLLFSSEERLTDPLSGALVQQPSSSIYAELLRRSAILRLIISRLHLLKGRLTADFFSLNRTGQYYAYELGIYADLQNAYISEAIHLTLQCIAELDRQVRHEGALFRVVIIPSDFQVAPGAIEKAISELGVSKSVVGDMDLQRPQRVLLDSVTDRESRPCHCSEHSDPGKVRICFVVADI